MANKLRPLMAMPHLPSKDTILHSTLRATIPHRPNMEPNLPLVCCTVGNNGAYTCILGLGIFIEGHISQWCVSTIGRSLFSTWSSGDVFVIKCSIVCSCNYSYWWSHVLQLILLFVGYPGYPPQQQPYQPPPQRRWSPDSHVTFMWLDIIGCSKIDLNG